MELKTQVKAEDGKQEIFITREFDLPVELLFKAYSEAELIEQWMGTKVIRLENKNLGFYQFETSQNGNVVFRANGAIHRVVENQKIIRTFEMENTSIGVQLEFLDFEKISMERSKLTIQIIYQTENQRAAQLKLPFASGLNAAHNRLQEIAISKR
ncbi:uncharacterized protein YndB with AHSA1/START domain [Algoriphagus iocasae]|uniref:Uncharacterized protein YndB with AHSA1/START domain n=1 Tax=Algoriphagus iocasae TaxID=1836499 RepID=A0A841MCS5_9BACT|nr:SRPBCC domain-containing protein [Algoriphagus iocasae]MBB6325862.1 uncharacterized protein YndB with AHSA1/START domain [Algoriphagus iocasae]